VRIFRVFPYTHSAAVDEEGGALYVPAPSPLGRIANIDLYRELYFTKQPEAAVAEVFGFLQSWHADDFIHAGGNPYCLSAFEMSDASVVDLNDTQQLADIGIARPSDVVTRDRTVTQRWAREIFLRRNHSGVSWWSYYCPEWTAIGIWNLDSVLHIGPPQPLNVTHESVIAASKVIVRQIAY